MTRLSALLAAMFIGLFMLAPIPQQSFVEHSVAQSPVPTPTPPVIPPTPVVKPIAEIIGPDKAVSSFFVQIRTTPGAVDTWRNVFPVVNGVEVKPNVWPLLDGSVVWYFQEPPAGVYVFRLRSQIPSTDPPLDPIVDIEHATLVTGLGPQPPTPDPNDPVEPDTPTPPVTTGKRFALLLYETTTQSVEMGRMLVLLRRGPSADYLASKGHMLDILDINLVDPSKNKPSPTIEKYRADIAGMQLPVLIVADRATGKLISKDTLPATAKDTDVIDAIKKAGG